VADYAASLAPLVANRTEIRVFGTGRGQRVPGMRVRSVGSYVRSAESFDAAFYHLGNNPHHASLYWLARERPGIVVLHDLVLHHFLETFSHSEQRAWMYEDPLAEEYGSLGHRLAQLADHHLTSRDQMFLFPLIGHVARRARGVVVHTGAGRRLVEEAAPGVPVSVIPHFAPPPPEGIRSIAQDTARRRLGLPGDAFLVGHFGFLTRPKQPAAVLHGFADLHRLLPDARLLLVGADHTGGIVRELATGLGLQEAIVATGYVDLARFHLYLRAVDVVVALRYPSAGETSGALVRALAEGRPVIVSDHASTAELPGEAVLRVAVDGPAEDQVAAHLTRLAGDAELGRRLGRAAGQYARTALDPERCRDGYVGFAEQLA
jgi:glycosyltransferase involved in cell wall biosynthesis